MSTSSLPVQLVNATKRYGSENVVNGFSFEAEPGEIVALLGPNGAGKTTSISMMLGLKRMTSGTASIFGRTPTDNAARQRTGIMLQESGLPATLKVSEIVELFSRFYPNPISNEDAIEAAMLTHKAGNKIANLSGGERQRLYFALAIIGDPDLLFLDEPSVGMDVTARGIFWDRIRQMHARGKTIILTTHYLEEADALAERIVVMNKGHQVAAGTPAQIKAGVMGKIVRFRSSQIVAATAALNNLPGLDKVVTNEDRAELYTKTPEEAVRALLNGGFDIRALEVTGASLEEAFVALTSDPAA
ncbi:MAG: ABC transporter ATP-binding protein [Thermomicrobiales bacterium]